MKTIILSLLMMYALPAALPAQPTISTNEFYYIGDVIQMVNCDPSGLDAGAPGANVMWNFSWLAPTGSTSVTTIVHDTTTGFSTSDLLITLPTGLKQHVQENSTDSYLHGTTDTSTGLVINYYNCDISKRPITYLTVYTDTYQVVIAAPATHGAGHITTSGDAYGTLVLPNGTYNNVLRVKKSQSETDTTGLSSVNVTVTTSYLWFDDVHNPPLLRIDSVTGATSSVTDVMYLTIPTGITTLNSSRSSYYSYLDNSNGLVVTGSFEYGKTYEVVLYDIIGTKIFSKEFVADDNTARFDMERQVNPGIYIVSITDKNDPSDKEVMKIVKQ